VGLSTPLSEIVALGPFVSRRYEPGQRLVFDRNPHYFRKAADGGALPYVDRVTIDIIPDQNAEMLRLEAGQIDTMTSEIAPEAYAPLNARPTPVRAAAGSRRRYNANALWFNLKPGAIADRDRARWLPARRASPSISMAVDRQQYVDTVFLGAGVPVYGPETPANKQWYWAGEPKTPHDPAARRSCSRRSAWPIATATACSKTPAISRRGSPC